MKVLGVDPGMAETGWAVVLGGPGGAHRLVASGVVRTAARRPLPERLADVHSGLSSVICEHRPLAMAVEEMFFLLPAHTVRASLQARGVVLLAAAVSSVPVHEYNPRQVKSALTGNGAASKAQVQRMTARLLGLAEVLRPDDVADAAAIAICHLRAGRVKTAAVLARIGGSRGAGQGPGGGPR